MSNRLSVLLVYESPDRKRRVPLARVVDARLTASAARLAIEHAAARAVEIERTDAELGVLERAEARRLRDVLGALVPPAINRTL